MLQRYEKKRNLPTFPAEKSGDLYYINASLYECIILISDLCTYMK